MSGGGSGPAARARKAAGRLPNSGSGTATHTAASTAGCSSSACSTSSGWMFSPPEMKRASRRPVTDSLPPSSRPRSPLANQPFGAGSRPYALLVEVSEAQGTAAEEDFAVGADCHPTVRQDPSPP